MKLWNEIDYETQKRVMDLIEELLLKQKEIDLQDGMAAALAELEVWSNSPCQIIGPNDPVEASDWDVDAGWDV